MGGIGDEVVTETVVDWLVEPPVPVQVNVNVVFAVRFPVLCEPEVPLVPVQPPDALHEVAFAAFHVRVELPPDVTELGLA